jgi:hypothetical protein
MTPTGAEEWVRNRQFRLWSGLLQVALPKARQTTLLLSYPSRKRASGKALRLLGREPESHLITAFSGLSVRRS